MKVACATVMKSLLLAAILVALTGHGSAVAVAKLSDCCTSVNSQEISETILGFLVQRRTVDRCVKAVIFQTETGYYCFKHNAPWVIRKVQELMRKKKQEARSTSALKLISSSSSPPSSASSSSTSSS